MKDYTMNKKMLPDKLYTAEQVRALDRTAIETIPVDGFDLMKKAGRAAFRVLLRHWPDVKSLSVFCGGGNNGGDGLVIAGLAVQKGISVDLVLLVDPCDYKREAASAWNWLKQLADKEPTANALLAINERQADGEITAEVVVDCLLGTGLTGDVRGRYAEAIKAINYAEKPVLAVDIPSGLCSDTGRVLGCAVKAEQTITFIGVKQGLLTGEAPNWVGQLRYDALDVPESVFNQVDYSCLRADWSQLKNSVPRRSRIAHKGAFGRVLIIGGDYGMAGAALMAAEAACRVGAGLIYAVTRPEHVPAWVAHRPEIMVKGIDITQHVEAMLEQVDVVVIGPGLGQQAWGQQLFQKAILADKPMIIDADALNLLAQQATCIHQNIAPRDNWVLTPHSGEAARLLDCTINEVEQDRFNAVSLLQKKYGGTVILKGAGTLIASSTSLYLINTGNPGMASGGMGDVLSGLLGGLLAQKEIQNSAVAPIAVALHGEAANLASKVVGEYSLLASDVINAIPELLREN